MLSPTKHFLFVCTGNACRSVLAEYYFHKKSSELGVIDVTASSAGISAVPSFKVPGVVIRLLQKEGVRFMEHKPTPITHQHVDDADIICYMEADHERSIIVNFPEAEKKVFQLFEYAFGRPKDIVDPIGQDDLIYELCFKDIKNCIDEILLHKLKD